MLRRLALAVAVLGAGLTAIGVTALPARARVLSAVPGGAAATIGRAAEGDTVLLGRGVHPGPLLIARRIVLRGAPGAIVDGRGNGTVIVVTASGAAIEDLTLRGSGRRVITIDAGVAVKNAACVALRRLVMRDVLYGVQAERADSLTVGHCDLAGRVRPLDEDGEGNGIHLWYSAAARLEHDTVRGFVDAIYLSFAQGARVEGCRLERNGRYGLHTMYCQGTHLTGNVFAHNVAGCAIMFSAHLRIEGNAFAHNRGPRTYGLLLRDCSYGEFLDNTLVDNTIAVFMDNSNRNRFGGNLVQDNGWGVLLYASCAGNLFAGNSFINDDYPVALDMRRSDNRFDDGRRGNYWSEHAAYDLDGDGVSDVPYSPVSAFAFLSKQYPDLTVLAKSPAVAALGAAERVFPALRPSEVVDRHPLTAPPRTGARGTGAGAPPRAWAAVWGFGGLLGVAVAGLARRGSA